MFNRVLWRLTAWYLLVLLVILMATGGISYVMLSRSLGDEVDSSLRTGARDIASQLNEDRIKAVTAAGAAQREEGDDDPEGEEHEDDPEEIRFFSSGGGDNFYLLLTPEGQPLLNPLNLPGTFFDPVATKQAVNDGDAWRTVKSAGGEYRTYFLPVVDDGQALAVVQVGRSLSEHSRQLRTVILVLAVSSATGLGLAAAGGLLLSGRTLQPVRQAFSRQREFVADASHELRTPLALVRGNAEILEMSQTARLGTEDRQYLSAIVREVEHMERLVSDLSTLARMDEAALRLEREPLSVSGLVHEVAEQARLLAARRDLRVEGRSQDGLFVNGDRVRLREVLLVLLDNAIRATPPGGRIILDARLSGGRVEVSVSDTGPGISPEEQQRIFQRFYRVDKARSRAEGGFGLGLAIAKGIAEAHGGTLTVSSPPGEGAAFTLSLPPLLPADEKSAGPS